MLIEQHQKYVGVELSSKKQEKNDASGKRGQNIRQDQKVELVENQKSYIGNSECQNH